MSVKEQDIVKIIANSGEGKMKAFEALKCIKTKEFKKARELLKESRQVEVDAHNAQTQIIANKEAVTLLMVHAQDHYMTCQLARDLIEALIDIFEE